MLPKVLIRESAWREIAREVDYWAHHPKGSKEALLYPLFGFARKDKCLKAPWEMLELHDIAYFVVTHAFAPPREYCSHGGAHAGIRVRSQKEEERFQEILRSWAKPITRRFPTLDIGALHSHQFSRGWAQSSGADRSRLDEHLRYFRQRKLNTPLEIVVAHAWENTTNLFKRWVSCCFGYNAEGRFTSLGYGIVIPDGDILAQQVMRPCYQRLPSGIAWERNEREQTPEIEAIDPFDFGWTGVRMKYAEKRYIYVYLPPQFPRTNRVLFQTLDTEKGKWGTMRVWEKRDYSYDFHLREILHWIRHEKELFVGGWTSWPIL